MDEIKIQELGLPSHRSSKSLALKTIIEKVDKPFKEDDVEKEIVFLAKNF